MELTPYIENLRRDLAAAAAAGGPEVGRAADLLAGSVESSARLLLLETLSDAAAEITTKLAHPDGSPRVIIDVRMRGRDAQFVVTETAPTEASPPTGPAAPESDAEITRLTLRVPEGLKDAVERLAAAEQISVNAWLVRAIAHAVGGNRPGPSFPPGPPSPPGRGRGGRRITGFAQA
jgi:hypothetical protein